MGDPSLRSERDTDEPTGLNSTQFAMAAAAAAAVVTGDSFFQPPATMKEESFITTNNLLVRISAQRDHHSPELSDEEVTHAVATTLESMRSSKIPVPAGRPPFQPGGPRGEKSVVRLL